MLLLPFTAVRDTEQLIHDIISTDINIKIIDSVTSLNDTKIDKS
jgi:hypothetical protein